jgi:hypothetical protein
MSSKIRSDEKNSLEHVEQKVAGIMLGGSQSISSISKIFSSSRMVWSINAEKEYLLICHSNNFSNLDMELSRRRDFTVLFFQLND